MAKITGAPRDTLTGALRDVAKITPSQSCSSDCMYVVFRGGPHSSLMFCTNGVLLRMLTSGDGLEGVTHIVVDEIHERDKFADFLLIMLRDLLPSKPHLHLVLMSATLNVALFQNYFHGCPLIQVPGYTYPVQVGSTICAACIAWLPFALQRYKLTCLCQCLLTVP